MTETKPLQILSVQAENFQRLTAVRIDPESGLNIIAGDNEQGKSSTLDAIELLLCGKTVMHPEAVRRGTRKATLTAEIGTTGEEPLFTIERVITTSGIKLKVTPRDGELPPGGAQSFLSGLTNSIAFDPFEFITMKPDAQANLLRRIAKIDTSQIDVEYKSTYDGRTDVNREIKSLEGQLAAFPIVAGAPSERVDTAELVATLKRLAAVIEQNNKARREFALAEEETEKNERLFLERKHEIEELEALLKKKKEAFELASYTRDLLIESRNSCRKEIEVLEDPDTKETEEQLATASDKNALFEKKERRAAISKQLEAKQKKVESLTATLEGIVQEKSDMLAAGEFPVQGLGIDSDGVVTFDGLPLCQASTSQKIRVSMAIAAALNPELRVVLIRNGNDVDKNKLKVIAETAREMNLQVLMERIEPGQGVPCFIIEDGTVSDVKGKQAT